MMFFAEPVYSSQKQAKCDLKIKLKCVLISDSTQCKCSSCVALIATLLDFIS